ncbi:MAG: hypothetical protein R2682_13640 [Pyrinomonadaceae bacterium]
MAPRTRMQEYYAIRTIRPYNGTVGKMAQMRAADVQVKGGRSGWLPFYPQFGEIE